MDTATQLITEHLDTWTASVRIKTSAGRGGGKKRELYGIKKLRELILELAVRGLLVPQDPEDEPASELLKQIKKEKVQRLEQGVIKKTKKLPPIKKSELPYQLPTGWSWVRFGDISIIERGGSPRPIKSYITESAEGLNWIKIGDTDQGGKYIRSTAEKITADGLKKTRMVYPGDFLLTNSMSFGRPYITLIEGCIHDGWLRISPPESLDKDFLYNLLSSPFVHRSFKASASGAVVQNLNSEKVRALPISLPPLAEQHRIVAKVNELMALCDRLEQEQSDHIATHETLVKTLLDALVDSASDAATFQEAWQRIAEHFDALFTTEASIDQLKQSILQLAVMGKLVPQDPKDEPASELLNKIAAEKAKLVKEGKIKKQRKLPEVFETDGPFSLCKTWEWTRLGSVTRRIHYGYTAKANAELDDVRLLRITDIQNDTVDWESVPGCEISSKETSQYKLQPGDILIARTGGTVGKSFLVEDINVTSVFASYLIRLEKCTNMYDRYLKLFLGSHLYWKQLIEGARGAAQPNVNGQTLSAMIIPLPPLAEQHRIVAKVDELMALCDALKTKLQAAQATQLQLTDSLVEQAVG